MKSGKGISEVLLTLAAPGGGGTLCPRGQSPER